jgi:hypothetical protein
LFNDEEEEEEEEGEEEEEEDEEEEEEEAHVHTARSLHMYVVDGWLTGLISLLHAHVSILCIAEMKKEVDEVF